MALNKVMIIGKCGGDPEIRESNGSKVATISVATTERYKDKSGESKEQTEWHRVIAWNHMAEFASKNIRKGSQVYVEGKLRTRKWKDRDGIERYTTEIISENLQALGRKADTQNTDANNDAF